MRRAHSALLLHPIRVRLVLLGIIKRKVLSHPASSVRKVGVLGRVALATVLHQLVKSNAMSVWLSLSVNLRAPAYDVVSKVAMSAEQMSKSQGDGGVCMQSTCRLVSLAKRTLILLVVAMSFLTIFGYLI